MSTEGYTKSQMTRKSETTSGRRRDHEDPDKDGSNGEHGPGDREGELDKSPEINR